MDHQKWRLPTLRLGLHLDVVPKSQIGLCLTQGLGFQLGVTLTVELPPNVSGLRVVIARNAANRTAVALIIFCLDDLMELIFSDAFYVAT